MTDHSLNPRTLAAHWDPSLSSGEEDCQPLHRNVGSFSAFQGSYPYV